MSKNLKNTSGTPDDEARNPESRAGDDLNSESGGVPMFDAVEKWTGETESPPSPGLQLVRVDQNERLFIPFTARLASVQIHFLPYLTCRGYVRCVGDGCVLCQIGLHVEVRDLLPLYDVAERLVVVVPVSPNIRPGALQPALLSMLRCLKTASKPLLFSLRKVGFTHYVVPIEFPSGADEGAAVVAKFKSDFDAGHIDLTSIYPQHSNEVLSQIDEVARQLKLRGLA